jgi:hypothetical protein
MEKALIKYDGIEFSLPLVTDNHNPTFIFLNRIGRIFLLNILERKDKKTSSLKFQVMSCTYNFNLKQKNKTMNTPPPTYFPSISHFVAMSQADGILFEIEIISKTNEPQSHLYL